MIVHIALNGLIVFFVFSGLIELVFRIFRIKNYRMRYLLRCLPIIKLPFDLVYFVFFDESFLINLNPFSCEVYVGELLAKVFSPTFGIELSTFVQLMIPAYIIQFLPESIVASAVWAILFVASFLLALRFSQFLNYKKFINQLLIKSLQHENLITNDLLKRRLNGLNAVIVISDALHVPFACGSRYIFFPEHFLKELSQEEFEAVVAHELEHLYWKDPFFKLMNTCVRALFWWIPMKWWMRRLECEQEQASDAAVHRYHINPCTLADALLKVISRVRYRRFEMASICPLDSGNGQHQMRFEMLLNSSEFKNGLFSLKNILSAILCGILFSLFWIC